MSWTLLGPKPSDSIHATNFVLPNEGIAHVVLILNSNIGVVRPPLHPQVHTELGRITVGPFGAKLEAIDDTLSILSGLVHAGAHSTVAAAVDPRIDKYQLKARVGERTEAIFLRHGDVISSIKATATLTCRWTTPEVQVDSSAAEVAASTEVQNGVADTPADEQETEDEDLDNTVVAVSATQTKSTQGKSQHSRGTPGLSNQQSLIVQETPIAARVNVATDYPDSHDTTGLIETTPSRETAASAETEAFSTARTGGSQNRVSTDAAHFIRDSEIRLSKHLEDPFGASAPAPIELPPDGVDSTSDNVTPQKGKSSPRVEIPARSSRKHPAVNEHEPETESEPVSRSSKRAKTTASSQEDTQDSRMSSIIVDTSSKPKTVSASKGKKRLSEVSEATEATPPRSQRNSQRSTTVSTDVYEGPTPRVAFSSSSITKTSQAVKFLKKQGGALVESINDHFNILCVRDGDIHKTSKVLQSIARGTPIVTDKWLFESAKVGHFLSVSAYRPSAPKQEKEWNIKLDDVWGQPQTPFDGYTIHFTKNLKAVYSPFTEIEQVCKAAGAKKVTTTRLDKTGNMIVLAKDDDDAEAKKLMQEGITCYHRDLITHSIFRGFVDFDSDEFKIKLEAAAASAPKETKKGRKSM